MTLWSSGSIVISSSCFGSLLWFVTKCAFTPFHSIFYSAIRFRVLLWKFFFVGRMAVHRIEHRPRASASNPKTSNKCEWKDPLFLKKKKEVNAHCAKLNLYSCEMTQSNVFTEKLWNSVTNDNIAGSLITYLNLIRILLGNHICWLKWEMYTRIDKAQPIPIEGKLYFIYWATSVRFHRTIQLHPSYFILKSWL